MRIRKNAKISPLMYAASSLKPGTLLQPHVCKLNQNPWDVINFSQTSTPPPPLPPPSFQVNGTDNLARNGSLRESNAAFQSAASLKIAADDEPTGEIKTAKLCSDGNGGNVGDSVGQGLEIAGLKKEKEIVYCVKTDGKAWKCKREAAEGNSLCRHHLSQVRSYNSALPATKKEDKVAAESKRRAPRAKKATSTSNSNEFYYYSGFGPRWGKKRGKIQNNVTSSTSQDVPKNVEQEREMVQSTFSQIDNEESENEYEEEEVEEGGESGRKRVRKPIKARSLRSLM